MGRRNLRGCFFDAALILAFPIWLALEHRSPLWLFLSAIVWNAMCAPMAMRKSDEIQVAEIYGVKRAGYLVWVKPMLTEFLYSAAVYVFAVYLPRLF